MKKNYRVVVKDSKEQLGWVFEDMTVANLKTGDYTLAGLEKELSIERKGSVGEFSKNICEERFTKELIRLNDFKHPFLILEFTMNDIYSFPYGSGIPSKIWPQLKITSSFIIKRLIEIETDYKVKVILAGDHGQEIAERIFKRMEEVYG